MVMLKENKGGIKVLKIEDNVNAVSLNEKRLEVYDNNFIVFECLTEEIEMFQVKMFYYQEVPGLYPFRYSMSQHKSFIYYKCEPILSLVERINQGISLQEFFVILKQLKAIFENSRQYLLYEENIQLSPEKIRITVHENTVSVECMYIPLKRKHQKSQCEEYSQLMLLLAKTFSEFDYLEGYYYFTRVLQDIKEGIDCMGFYKHLEYFLSSRKTK